MAPNLVKENEAQRSEVPEMLQQTAAFYGKHSVKGNSPGDQCPIELSVMMEIFCDSVLPNTVANKPQMAIEHLKYGYFN